MADSVNHPTHYAHVSGVECIEIAEHLGFNLGNAFKYVWRAGLKSALTPTGDYSKALWYLERWRDQSILDRPRIADLQPRVWALIRRVLAVERGERKTAFSAIARAWDTRLTSHASDAWTAICQLRERAYLAADKGEAADA